MNVLISLLLLLPSANANVTFQKTRLRISDKVIVVEIADNDSRRQQGLMFRKKLSKNQGMLFIFSEEKKLSFWMKNTFIPLSIGFFNKDKRLIDIQTMTPSTSIMEAKPKSYQSKSPAMYALEMNRGWFKSNKIKLGDKFALLKNK